MIHSYTKDLSGHGSTTAGVIIGRNERMFIPKHESAVGPGPDGKPRTWAWDETLFWNVYYVKGAFLDADKAFEVLTGMHTLELRVLRKAVNTLTLAEISARTRTSTCTATPRPATSTPPSARSVCIWACPRRCSRFDFEGKAASGSGAAVAPFHRETFKRFFDCLEPTFGHQVSLGQPNTVVLCPAITSHSEMSEQSLRDAGIQPTTVRIAVGLEDPRTLVAHLVNSGEDHARPRPSGLQRAFPSPEQIDAIYRKHFSSVHARYVEAMPTCASLMS